MQPLLAGHWEFGRRRCSSMMTSRRSTIELHQTPSVFYTRRLPLQETNNSMDLPPPLSLDADEPTAQHYVEQLSRACEAIVTRPLQAGSLEPVRAADLWIAQLARVELDAATRVDLARRFGPGIADEKAARQALALWRSVESWHEGFRARTPRYALRHLMSDLSEDAYCASWHPDTEFALWELIHGGRHAWMRLSGNDPRIAELRRLHEATGGWWRHNDDLDDGWGATEFVPTPDWRKIYALTVRNRDRAMFAVVDGKPLRGKPAMQGVVSLLNRKKQ